MGVKECVYCREAIVRADDGAWEGAEDGACGCTVSLEQGGDGEHEPVEREDGGRTSSCGIGMDGS